tara:strand:+ start:3830 stop:4348 length:519 start_codon:yes stop_codon:yes gene_type:complete
MSLKFFSILVFIFSIGCSTSPVKYDKPVKVDDYKNFVRLKEEKENPVSEKPISQKIKEKFTLKSKPNTIKVDKVETNKVEIKKSTPLSPSKRSPLKRRIRQTTTNTITSSEPKLLPMAPRVESEPPRDLSKSIMLYFIYLQAFIILIFAFMILRRRKKVKEDIPEKTGELNL